MVREDNKSPKTRKSAVIFCLLDMTGSYRQEILAIKLIKQDLNHGNTIYHTKIDRKVYADTTKMKKSSLGMNSINNYPILSGQPQNTCI